MEGRKNGRREGERERGRDGGRRKEGEGKKKGEREEEGDSKGRGVSFIVITTQQKGKTFEVLHCLFLVMSKGCYLKQNPLFVPLHLADSQCLLLEMPGE